LKKIFTKFQGCPRNSVKVNGFTCRLGEKSKNYCGLGLNSTNSDQPMIEFLNCQNIMEPSTALDLKISNNHYILLYIIITLLSVTVLVLVIFTIGYRLEVKKLKIIIENLRKGECKSTHSNVIKTHNSEINVQVDASEQYAYEQVDGEPNSSNSRNREMPGRGSEIFPLFTPGTNTYAN
jgi:hypothetical protein